MNEQNVSKELTVPNEKALAEFTLTPAKVEEMAKEFMHLTVPKEDKDAYRIARAALTVCVKARTGTDARRKDLGSEAREWLADVAEAARSLVEPLIPVEAHLKAEVYSEDNRIKEIKEEKARIEAERVEEIRNKIKAILDITTFMNQLTTSEGMHSALAKAEAIEITEEEYMEFAFEAQKTRDTVCSELATAIETREKFEAEEAAKKAEEKKREQEQKAEDERLAQERKALEVEKAKQDAIAEEQKKEADRLELASKEHREKEHALVQAQIKAQEEEQERIDTEKKRLEMQEVERQANVKAAAEAEAIAKKAQEDAKAKLEQGIRDKEEREKAEAEEKARIEALRPDKEKMLYWIKQVANTLDPLPEFKSEEARGILMLAVGSIEETLLETKQIIESL